MKFMQRGDGPAAAPRRFGPTAHAGSAGGAGAASSGSNNSSRAISSVSSSAPAEAFPGVPGAGAPMSTCADSSSGSRPATAAASTTSAASLGAPAPAPRKRMRFIVDNASTIFDEGAPEIRATGAAGGMVGGRRSFAEFNRGVEALAAGRGALAINDNASAAAIADQLGVTRRAAAAKDRSLLRKGAALDPAAAARAAGGIALEEARRSAYADRPHLNPGGKAGRFGADAADGGLSAGKARSKGRKGDSFGGGGVPIGVKRARPYDKEDDEDSDVSSDDDADDDADSADAEVVPAARSKSSGGFTFASASASILGGSGTGLHRR